MLFFAFAGYARVATLGAAAASLGALLALFAGIGRTSLAMARDGELLRPLARVHPRFGVPHVAELTVGMVVVAVGVGIRLIRLRRRTST